MSPYAKRKLIKNVEAKVLPLTVIAMFIVAGFTAVFVFNPITEASNPPLDVLNVFDVTADNKNDVDFTSDGTYIVYSASASGGNYGINIAWTSNWTMKQQLNASSTAVLLDISPDDSYLAYDYNNNIVVIDVNGESSWTHNTTIITGQTVDDVKFSEDSSYIVIACQDNKVRTYWTSNWTLDWTSADLGDDAIGLAWSDTYLAVGNKDSGIDVFWIGNWTTRTVITTPADRIYGLAFSHDGNYLAAGDHVGNGYLFWASNFSQKGSTISVTGSTRGADFSETNDFFSFAGTDDKVKTYWTSNVSLYKTTTTNISGDVAGLSYSLDSSGSYLAVACGAGAVVVYDASEGQDATSASVFTIKGLTNGRVTWNGTSGGTVWCNSSGLDEEWLEYNMSINSTDNITCIRVSMDDLNDTSAWVNASNITCYVSSDNASYGLLGTFTDGGSNCSNDVNSSNWNAGTMGANPFAGAGLANKNTSIYFVFKVAIPADMSSDRFYSATSSSFSIIAGKYV